MPLALLLNGLGVFVILVLAHAALRRAVRVTKEILFVSLLFLLCPLLGLLIWKFWLAPSDSDWWSMALLLFSLSLAYLQTYPALRIQVPTFRILLAVHRSEPRGIDKEQVVRQLEQDQEFFGQKITEMENDAFIRVDGDKLILTPQGKAIALFFRCYRRILGLESGKG